MDHARTTTIARLLAGLVVTAVLAVGCSSGGSSTDGGSAGEEASDQDATGTGEPELRFDGPEAGALINATDLEGLTFTVTATGDAGAVDDLVMLLDGDDVTADAEVEGATLTYAPEHLPDGERTLAVAAGTTVEDGEVPGDAVEDGDPAEGPDPAEGADPAEGSDAAAGADPAEGSDAAEGADVAGEPEPLHAWRFEVKAEPPSLELSSPDGAVLANEPLTVAGVTEAGATVAVGGDEATADDTGAFELELADVEDELTIVVTDVAGNSIEVIEELTVIPSRVEIDEIRTVHATFWAWATPSLREPIVEMIDDVKINAVQLDLKDEGGHLGYDSQVPLAKEIGAGIGPLDLEAAVAGLHERDVAVIGRIVAFADPTLASWAWENDRREWVIQDRDGNDYYRGSYAGFSNYTHPDVIAYNLDIAEEAAAAGVDHILWDYIRRPEGMDSYTVPGLETTPEEAIVEFTRLADERLAPYGVQHAASVYGIAADRPEQIGQDIPAMAEHLDYVAPMIYPSHWGVGEYGVADPNRQPYDIVRATLEVWDEAVEGRRARVVPWLEDTTYRAWDRPFQVREQIRATRDHGIAEWMMWNPGSRFTPEAYDRRD